MATRSSKVVGREKPDRLEFTHTDKVMFPVPGFTKGDVLEFYRKIAPLLLPHLRDRPVTVERLPDGLVPGGKRFWQKNIPTYYPDWIQRIKLPTKEGAKVTYALVNDLDTLLYLVNQGVLTFHVWLSRVDSLKTPDYVLFDLDLGEAKFPAEVKIALHLRELLTQRKADAYVKTSGKTGLHVLTPWKGNGGYDAARAWAMQIAQQVVRDLPNLATVERLKSERHAHVYIDVIQNAMGHHAVPPYVLRAVPEATVSTPLDWNELTARLDPKAFTMPAVLRRVAKQKRDLMQALVS
jgi:bifunctional non-homologous end joining protein LigD